MFAMMNSSESCVKTLILLEKEILNTFFNIMKIIYKQGHFLLKKGLKTIDTSKSKTLLMERNNYKNNPPDKKMIWGIICFFIILLFAMSFESIFEILYTYFTK
jgi:hypothetical protein